MVVTARQSYIEMILSMLDTGMVDLSNAIKADLVDLAGMHREWAAAEEKGAETQVLTRAMAKLRHEIRYMS